MAQKNDDAARLVFYFKVNQIAEGVIRNLTK